MYKPVICSSSSISDFEVKNQGCELMVYFIHPPVSCDI